MKIHISRPDPKAPATAYPTLCGRRVPISETVSSIDPTEATCPGCILVLTNDGPVPPSAGPWSVVGHTRSKSDIRISAPGIPCVVTVHGRFVSRNEQEANVRLIENAAGLFSLTRRLVEAYEGQRAMSDEVGDALVAEAERLIRGVEG